MNGLWMFYAFYETPMLRTVHVMCYIFILHQWKKSTYLISRFDVSVMLKCYIDLFGQQVCDNLFFYQHKKDHLPFWICFDVCNLIFYLNGKLFLYYFFDMLFIDTYMINHTVHCVLFKTSSFWIFSLAVPNCFINVIFA